MKAVTNTLPATADNEIVQTVADLSVARFPGQLRSIVLTGSIARNEATWVNMGVRLRLEGDAEFLLVFENRKALPSSHLISRLCVDVEARLAGQDIDAHIDLSPVESEYLRSQKPHIFAYELITHGKVVWGDSRILDLVPPFTPAEIPLEDGYRTLLNRMTELLEALCQIEDSGTSKGVVAYRAMKLSLDMATSFLLFERRYQPSYRDRARCLSELPALSVSCPIPHTRFINRVQMATRQKLCELNSFGALNPANLSELVSDLHMLWRWELEKLTAPTPGTSDSALMHQWAAEQQRGSRARGWTSVAKRYGVTSSLVHLARWSRLYFAGSPRRLLYAAASELMFAMPDILLCSGPAVVNEYRWDELRMSLPISDPPGSVFSVPAWQRLGLAIAWNYHRFLKSTRS